MKNKTYIIGHKNPDADAICSAIAYAAYKKETGHTGYIAARCGNSNDRIDAILKRFNQKLPLFVGDVTPRVKDLMIRDIHKIAEENTCAEALEMIDKHDVRILPVVSNENHIKGFVSIFKLGEFFIPKPRESKEMRHVCTSINDIVRSLKAEVMTIKQPDKIEDLYVRVGAMDISTFGSFTQQELIPAEESIIVVGNRYDIQNKSIHAGVRLLVVTGGLEIEDEIQQMAKDRGVSLIVSPYDSASTSWIIRTASRVEHMLDTNFITFSQEEKLSVVRRKVANNYAPAYFVTDDENKLVGIFSRTDILKPVETGIILVDHNEISQAVPGANLVKIREIIDHHRLGNLATQQPILFFNEPVGSTCTIVADLFRREQIPLSADIAGIMMSGIISDTLKLNSPTSTSKDKDLLHWLSEIAKVNIDDLANMIFSSGSLILSEKPEAVIRSDLKTYPHGDVKYSVSQIEELGFENFKKEQLTLQKSLKAIRHQEGLLFSALLVTDINTQNSMLVVDGDPEVIEQISYPKVSFSDEIFELNSVVSRKKQLIPYLTTILNSIGVMA